MFVPICPASPNAKGRRCCRPLCPQGYALFPVGPLEELLDRNRFLT